MSKQCKHTQEEIDDALRRYSNSELVRGDLYAYGFDWFSDVIDGLARLSLRLPRFDSKKRFNEKQLDLYNKIFKKL